MALVDNRHNTKTSRNGSPIKMYQGGTPHKPFFIAIDCWGQVIIGPNKKIVATHVLEELEVLVWFMGTQILKWGYCYDQCLLETAWIWIKGMTIWLAAPHVVSVSASYRRCCYLALSLWSLHILFLIFISLLNYGLV